jgi:hypothetical protein
VSFEAQPVAAQSLQLDEQRSAVDQKYKYNNKYLYKYFDNNNVINKLSIEELNDRNSFKLKYHPMLDLDISKIQNFPNIISGSIEAGQSDLLDFYRQFAPDKKELDPFQQLPGTVYPYRVVNPDFGANEILDQLKLEPSPHVGGLVDTIKSGSSSIQRATCGKAVNELTKTHEKLRGASYINDFYDVCFDPSFEQLGSHTRECERAYRDYVSGCQGTPLSTQSSFAPFIGVLAWQRDASRRKTIICTATLVAPSIILTARHCLRYMGKSFPMQHWLSIRGLMVKLDQHLTQLLHSILLPSSSISQLKISMVGRQNSTSLRNWISPFCTLNRRQQTYLVSHCISPKL